MAEEKILLEVEPEQITSLPGNRIGIKVSAILTRAEMPVEGRAIQFFIGGSMVGEPLSTDRNGRALKEDIVVGAAIKDISIEAQMVDTALRAKKIISLNHLTKKEFKVDITLVPTSNEFLVSVFTPGPEEKINIMSSVHLNVEPLGPEMEPASGTFFKFATDSDGNLAIRINFEGEKAVCHFQHISSGQDQKRMLIKDYPPPSKEPEKPLIDRLKDAYRRGRDGK